ncbi:cation diffusion facilitator family transporter [Moheibacter sediminis]|uniref:Cation diffusion facilitator family transporter n=1 Tax=Moheibacter sediminis TaxID=1434700 RepID=A0A1W1ZR10_9FLAO|nr:cation diffusion facilitator family transporter [Moheibacter sediminis]SMC50970.1 cation diffusion facilitator family transporter [Moheibacter sediminis]
MSSKTAIRTSVFSIIGNLFFVLIKGAAGILGNSYALIADAIESTADVFSSILVLIGLKYSTKPADENHPYGHGRFETLTTFAVIGFLVVSATIIAYESIQNIKTPHEGPKTFTLFVLGGIIIFKELSYQYVIRKSRETHSSSLKADAWHHRSDAITSVMAFIGIAIAIFMGDGFEAADDWAALIASGIIIFNAYKIFRPVLREISDEQIYDDLIIQIREIAVTVSGVVDTEKCHVRKMGMTYYVDLHMIVDGNISVIEGHKIAHDLKDEIQKQIPQVADVLVHTEPDRVTMI